MGVMRPINKPEPRIREIREGLKMGIKTLSKKADVDRGHLSRLELGYSYPSVAVAHRLACVLGVYIEDLYTFDDAEWCKGGGGE